MPQTDMAAQNAAPSWEKERSRRRRVWNEHLAAFAFLTPNFVGFLIFTSLPVIASLVLAFLNWDIITKPRAAGFGNFVAVLTDREFWYYVWNTFFLMLRIPLNMGLSLCLALLLNRRYRGVAIYRTVFFLPTILSGIAIYVLWAWLLDADYGIVNRLLSYAGISGPHWLTDVQSFVPLPKVSLIIMGMWIATGGTDMILYLAGLQSIDPELYEAAEMDGANQWQQFWRITWPLLTPTTFFVFVMNVITGFQGGFEQAYIMTLGGPTTKWGGSTTTVGYYIYNQAFVLRHMGIAAAAAWFLFAVIFTMTLLNWKYGGKRVQYY